MIAKKDMLFYDPKGRLSVELIVLTKEVIMCASVVRLGPLVCTDLKAVVLFACCEPSVLVSVCAATADKLDPVALALVATARSASAVSEEAAAEASAMAATAKAMAAAAAEIEADPSTAAVLSGRRTAAAKAAAAARLAAEAAAAASTTSLSEQAALERLLGLAPILFTLRADAGRDAREHKT